MSTPYYVPSGRLPLRAVGLTIVCALLTIGPAWVYAWLTVHVPMVIVDGFALLAFAFGMGAAVHYVARRGKVRNPLWMGRLGMLVGVMGWYVQWVATAAILKPKSWLAASGGIWNVFDFADLLVQPQTVFEFAWALSHAGMYSILGFTPGSGVLITLWMAEFLFLITVPRMLARQAAEAPFCEVTDTWMDQGAAPQIVPDPPELIAAIDHLTCGRFEEALAGAVVHTTAAHDSLRIDALRLCALATARLERWDASLSYWTTLFEEDGSALNALQVATSSTMAGDVEDGKIWIARARERNAVSQEMPDLQLTTNFITALVQSGHTAQALPYLDEVRAVYIGLGITDPTFLFTRHVPSFSTFLDNSLPIVKTVLGQEEGRAWYASMLPHLDAPGKKTLMSWLDQHIATTPTPTPAAI